MYADAARKSRPRRLNRLWLVAAFLGIATAHLTMTIVHDTSRQHDAVRVVAQSLADQMAAQLDTRYSLLSARGTQPGSRASMRDSVVIPALEFLARVNARTVDFDSGTVQVVSPDSSVTVGAIHEEHSFRASAPAYGAMRGWTVLVALQHSQVSRALLMPVSDDRLWLLAGFGIVTIAVLIFAVGSSQRELLLARARSDFVAGVSHELRMPLAQILLAGETLTLARERSDAERKGLSSSIVREARRLKAIVDNILFFSRADASRMSIRMLPIGVTQLFGRVLESVDLAVADANQTIVTDVDERISVIADPDLARQALVNLVDNAIKYGKPGQCIRLCAERVGTRVQLHVDDEGPGIPKDSRTRVFEEYERLARDQVSERTGTGLGLAIVRRIAADCGGRVWIDTSPQGGARVTVELAATT
jgi:signal transduction histidine kinase